jgi:hypothetical protein
MHVEPSWTWPSGCCRGINDSCRGATTVTVHGDQLRFTGFCADPGYGGDYAHGSQSIDDLVARGPMRPMPQHIVEAILDPGAA